MRQFFAVLLAVACAAAGGCRLAKVETHSMEHVDLTAENPAPEEKEKALETLHSWALARGYTRLVTPADVAAATTWSGHTDPFKEVWRKVLDPHEPKSNLVLTVLDVERARLFEISLSAERWGDEADHARQIPMVETEQEEFYKVFADFPWLKQLKAKKLVPTGTVPTFHVEH